MYKILIIVLFLNLFFPSLVKAAEINQFITIINPVRLSQYNLSPQKSLIAQYHEISKRSLSATWLFTYDILTKTEIMDAAQAFDINQELGIFLEVTPQLAESSGVKYNKTDSWHRANSVFLSGYSQEDRIKLINTVFNKFKLIHGYYPKSVGSWWTDAYSLKYMQDKYGVSVNLSCADQFSTDSYQIWGQYWSTPYYPSCLHSGIPAGDENCRLNIVNLQWAPRDPILGYGSGKESLFSTQDYFTIGLGDDYFEKLVKFYSKSQNGNQFGHIVVGLEGDLNADSYQGIYARQLDIIKNLKTTGEYLVAKSSEFGEWYLEKFPNLSPTHIIISDNNFSQELQTFFYQSPYYRVGLLYDKNTFDFKIFDFRIYYSNFEEPYNISPNNRLDLRINIPSLFDQALNPESYWLLIKSEIEEVKVTDNILEIYFKNGKNIKFMPSKINLPIEKNKLPEIIQKNLLIESNSVTTTNLNINNKFNFSKDGYLFQDLTLENKYLLKTNRFIMIILSSILLYIFFIFWIYKKQFKYTVPLILVLIITTFLAIFTWYQKSSQTYFVNQEEISALSYLSTLPWGRVLTYDKDCLQCSWMTKYQPAVFANNRLYVEKFSGKKIVSNNLVFEAKTREDARLWLKKLNISYIYLTNFESYEELLPFSPGDYQAKLVYQNASSVIWEIQKDKL